MNFLGDVQILDGAFLGLEENEIARMVHYSWWVKHQRPRIYFSHRTYMTACVNNRKRIFALL